MIKQTTTKKRERVVKMQKTRRQNSLHANDTSIHHVG